VRRNNFIVLEDRDSPKLFAGFLVSLVFVAVFLPGHFLDWWVERFFTLIILASGFFVVLKFGFRYQFVPLFVVLSVLAMISMIAFVSSSYLYEKGLSFREASEFFRWCIYFFGTVLLYWISVFAPLKHLEFILKLLMCFSAGVGVFLYFDISPIADILSFVYEDTKTVVSVNWIRVGAPFENPNFLAIVTALSLLYFMICSLDKKRNMIPWVALSLFVLYLTGSRTGWILAFYFIFFIFIRSGFSLVVRNLFNFLIFFILIAFVVIHFSDVILSQKRILFTLDLFSGDVFEKRGIAGRLAMSMDALGVFLENPLVGVGPLKNASTMVVDNQYALILLRYGAIGLFFWLIFLFLNIYLVINRINFHILLAVTGLIMVLISGAYIDNFRVWFLIMVLIGMIDSASRKIER
jgi:hypothetical protein